jgi:ubiquinol-cytochrome c reductase cytochrome c1 subunit
MRGLLAVLGVVAMFADVGSALASSGGALKEVEFENSMEARQRGAETVVGVCMMCHSLKYLRFGDLANIGMSDEKIQSLLTDQKFEDRMISLTPLEVRKESYGKEPPDLSLMAIARKKGPQYIYTLLTGYYTDASGNADNHLFPGVKMPDMLGYSFAAEGSPERAQIEAQVRDTVAFLVWAADPNADARKELGVYVIIYLVILTILLYLVKRRTWSRIH